MKIAREIVRIAEERHGNARYEDIDTIVASADEWESIIAEQLRLRILNTLSAEVSIPFYAYGDNEAACRMATAIGEVVAMLSDEK